MGRDSQEYFPFHILQCKIYIVNCKIYPGPLWLFENWEDFGQFQWDGLKAGNIVQYSTKNSKQQLQQDPPLKEGDIYSQSWSIKYIEQLCVCLTPKYKSQRKYLNNNDIGWTDTDTDNRYRYRSPINRFTDYRSNPTQ